MMVRTLQTVKTGSKAEGMRRRQSSFLASLEIQAVRRETNIPGAERKSWVWGGDHNGHRDHSLSKRPDPRLRSIAWFLRHSLNARLPRENVQVNISIVPRRHCVKIATICWLEPYFIQRVRWVPPGFITRTPVHT